jgi:integrase
MSRTLKEAPLTTPNARSKLATGLHWRSLDPEVHLGYRKGKRGGVWVVRWRHGAGYRQAPLGTADDALKEGTLDFTAAKRKAREHVAEVRKAAALRAAGPVVTVRLALEEYLAERDERASRRAGRQLRSNASHRIGRHVLGRDAYGKQPAVPPSSIAEIPLHELTEADIGAWRDALPETIKAATRKRLINDLKAGLNKAAVGHRKKLPASIVATIKHGLMAPVEDDEPIARDNQILSDALVARLIAAAREVDEEGDAYRFILVLAATGARFSQVARLRVADCQVAEGRLMLPVSRKGRGKAGSLAVPVGRDVLDALVPVVAGRSPDALLLQRWRSRRCGGLRWERDVRGPWSGSEEIKGLWRAVREKAGLPEVIPYSLRHSSIVRGIRAGLPLRLVAALHDTSTVMIERHYSKYITSGLEEMARAAIVPLVPADGGRVVQLGVAG